MDIDLDPIELVQMALRLPTLLGCMREVHRMIVLLIVNLMRPDQTLPLHLIQQTEETSVLMISTISKTMGMVLKLRMLEDVLLQQLGLVQLEEQ